MINKLSCGQPGYYSLSIYPDGAVYPCCSGGFQIEGRLSCGNIHVDPPARILFRASGNLHVRLVKEFGWGLLYEMVARDAPELLAQLPSLEQASGVCEICRDLSLTLADRLAPIYERIESSTSARVPSSSGDPSPARRTPAPACGLRASASH